MIRIKPDKNRRIDIPGVPAPVERPVDIDQAVTGFTSLRTLRIYRFEAASVIEGHAEEDEVFIVLLSGSAELTMSDELASGSASPDPSYPVTLSAPGIASGVACAAYLPPGGAYKLVAKTIAEVAYARATPSGSLPPKVFFSSARRTSPGVTLVLEEVTYAERLRVRLVQINTQQNDAEFVPASELDASSEALVHVRTLPPFGVITMHTAEAGSVVLDSWDTVSIAPGDDPAFHVALGSHVLALIVFAVA